MDKWLILVICLSILASSVSIIVRHSEIKDEERKGTSELSADDFEIID